MSLGHAAYFGVAAYALALISPKYEAANLWLTLPAAIVIAGFAALVIGYLVVRTAGVYFIMVTLAFAQMLYAIFHDTKIGGGSDGIYILVQTGNDRRRLSSRSISKVRCSFSIWCCLRSSSSTCS